MALILDAYNVLHAAHVLPDRYSEIGVEGLCRMLGESGIYGGRIVVVCDGAPRALQRPVEDLGRVELIWAGGGKDADTLIEALIEAERAPRQLIVVSSDHRIQRAARRRRARAVDSEPFLRELAQAMRRRATEPTEPEKPTSAGPAEPWMRKFGLEEDKPIVDERALESETDHWMRQFGFEEDES